MRVLVTGGSGFIGTNLTEALEEKQIDFCNIDIRKPKNSKLNKYWIECDILAKEELMRRFQIYSPTHVVHLAAETRTEPELVLKDYLVNTVGSSNVIEAAMATESMERFILTSTQFVNQSEQGPEHDEDFKPHTVYGESKVVSEKILRASGIKCCWTIIRPTNIWGPWHLRYPNEFWKILAERKYFHPGRQKVIRSYGFVGNVVDQIITILTCEKTKIAGQVFYVGDEPIDLFEWVNAFSISQTGRNVRVIPRWCIRLLAYCGDALRLVGVSFPLTSSRYRSMTTDNPAQMGKTFKILGPARYTIQSGVKITVEWMRATNPQLVKP